MYCRSKFHAHIISTLDAGMVLGALCSVEFYDNSCVGSREFVIYQDVIFMGYWDSSEGNQKVGFSTLPLEVRYFRILSNLPPPRAEPPHSSNTSRGSAIAVPEVPTSVAKLPILIPT